MQQKINQKETTIKQLTVKNKQKDIFNRRIPVEKLSKHREKFIQIYNKYKKHHSKCNITYKELLTYITAPTNTGDTINPITILTNDYYLYHEIIEICKLKEWGIPINNYTILSNPKKCYEAHYHAIKEELKLAKSKNDTEWIKKRLNHIKSYLNDPNLPNPLKNKFKNLLKEFKT